MLMKSLGALSLIAILTSPQSVAVAEDTMPVTHDNSLSARDLEELKTLYKRLIDAENRHDISAVRAFVWDSPGALFVAKTATAEDLIPET